MADFGLTEERHATLAHGARWLWIPAVLLAYLALLGLAEWTGSTAPFVTALAFMWIPGVFLYVPLKMLLDKFWRRLQPDAHAFKQYERAIKQWSQAHAVWLTTQLSWWSRLHPSTFETQVGKTLRERGYTVLRTGRTGDGGVDLRVTAPGGVQIIVQCKRYRQPVGPAAVRELYGTLMHDGAQAGWLVSLTGFSKAAKQFAAGKSIRLLTIEELISSVNVQHSAQHR